MVGKNIGISQQTLVSNNGALGTKGDRTFQYIAGLASTLGALAAGMVLAWTSPAGKDGVKLKDAGYDFPISAEEFSWIGSLAPLGAAAICVPIGILTDLIGRKKAMLILVVPFTIGWICIIFAKSVLMMYIGRFILGLSGGAFCVTAPMYTAEIAENEIRGSLGSYFQLLLNCGILITYILGTFLNMFTLSIVSAIVPLIFFVVFSFMPETPIYYLKTGEENAARMSLKKLRGSQYNVEMELQNLQESMTRTESTNESFSTAIRSKAAIKGLIIAFGLMFFQQLSGINAIIFYAGDIFKAANKDSDPNVSTIIVGVMQTVAVFVSTLIVDRAGRKLLLVSSSAVMFITTLVLGIYFKLSESGNDVQSIGWLPLVSVCVFAILFAIGFGPIPWMMMGEIFAPSIKGVAASSACLFNWLMAFVVTKFFSNMRDLVQDSGTFWLFSVVCFIGVFFVIFVTPETKGKSLEDIQEELGN